MQPELRPVRTDDSRYGRGGPFAAGAGVAISPEAQKVMRNTYLLLAATMVPTIAGALLGMATGGIILQSPIMSSVIMLVAVIGLQFAIAKNRNSGVGVALLLLMTGILGWWLGPILNFALALKNGMQLVGYAAAGTGVIFFAMGAIATTTKRDFSFMGKFLFVGMIALLIAMFANMFFHIPALSLTISAIAVLIFSAYILFDVSRIVNGGETNYVMATLGLFLNIYNIFINLLSLLMAFSGDRD